MRPRTMGAGAVAAALAVAGCGGAGGAATSDRSATPRGATTTATAATATAPGAAAAAARTPGADAASGDAGAGPPPGPDVILVRRAGGVPDGWGARLRRIPGVAAVTRATRAQAPYLLAAVRTATAARRAERIFGTAARSAVSRLGPAPWNRRGLIARPVDLKLRFGEFALRLPIGPDWVTPDPAWVKRDIGSARVPVIGTVTCHRRMIPALRAAMRELVRRHLQRLVDPGDYAGCYAPRRIPTSGSLSLHAWGLAIDLNASRNPQGQKPHQDLRLVHVMERHGFWWGGRWPTVPDGMHFEYHGDGPPSANEPF